jgi:hypothetical protein
MISLGLNSERGRMVQLAMFPYSEVKILCQTTRLFGLFLPRSLVMTHS